MAETSFHRTQMANKCLFNESECGYTMLMRVYMNVPPHTINLP